MTTTEIGAVDCVRIPSLDSCGGISLDFDSCSYASSRFGSNSNIMGSSGEYCGDIEDEPTSASGGSHPPPPPPPPPPPAGHHHSPMTRAATISCVERQLPIADIFLEVPEVAKPHERAISLDSGLIEPAAPQPEPQPPPSPQSQDRRMQLILPNNPSTSIESEDAYGQQQNINRHGSLAQHQQLQLRPPTTSRDPVRSKSVDVPLSAASGIASNDEATLTRASVRSVSVTSTTNRRSLLKQQYVLLKTSEKEEEKKNTCSKYNLLSLFSKRMCMHSVSQE